MKVQWEGFTPLLFLCFIHIRQAVAHIKPFEEGDFTTQATESMYVSWHQPQLGRRIKNAKAPLRYKYLNRSDREYGFGTTCIEGEQILTRTPTAQNLWIYVGQRKLNSPCRRCECSKRLMVKSLSLKTPYREVLAYS